MKSAAAARQLIIGVDSMDFDLMQKWSAAGKLPTFARLLREGAHPMLSTDADRFPEPVWNYLCSGMNPAYFVRYFDVQHDSDLGAMRHVSGDWPGARYFWDHLSEAGQRVGVVDAPQVNSRARLNGFQFQWGPHALLRPRFSTPGTLLNEVERRFGRHPIENCDSMTSKRARIALRRGLLYGVKARAEMFRHLLRALVPRPIHSVLNRALPQRTQQQLLFRFYRNDRTWQGCRAFPVPNSATVGAIRSNLKGRDRDGIVEPGAEYERICDGICAALKESKEPVTGRALVRNVSRVPRELRGPYLDRLADLAAQWDTTFPWTAVHSPRFGTRALRGHDYRTASHTPHGFVIATGDGIGTGAIIPDASIYDFAPIIMHTAGLNPPAGCEGRPLFSR